MYVPDLAAFTQRGVEHIAVGWLSLEQAFPKGEVPPSFVTRLAKLAECPRAGKFGLHLCEFCDGNTPAVGNGEILVPHGPGRWYRAPQLIHHYVVAHAYRPPGQFIDAVLCAPPSAFEPDER